MPRAKISEEEAVANLNRRASEALQGLRRKRIEIAMNMRPSVIEHLWEKLSSLGLTDDQLKTPEGQAKSLQARAHEEKRKRKAEEQTVKAETAAQQYDETDTEVLNLPTLFVPDKCLTLESLPMSTLRDKVLPAIGGQVLSSHNLRSMLKDGGAVGMKLQCLRLWELCTGCQPDLALTGRLRCLNQIILFGQQRAEQRGHRAMSVTLPPVWEEAGLVELDPVKTERGEVRIKHRFTMQQVLISPADVPPHQSTADLFIAQNWSEVRCSLASHLNPSGDRQHFLTNYFKGQSVAVDEAGRVPMITPKKIKTMKDEVGPASASGSRVRGEPSADIADDGTSALLAEPVQPASSGLGPASGGGGGDLGVVEQCPDDHDDDDAQHDDVDDIPSRPTAPADLNRQRPKHIVDESLLVPPEGAALEAKAES